MQKNHPQLPNGSDKMLDQATPTNEPSNGEICSYDHSDTEDDNADAESGGSTTQHSGANSLATPHTNSMNFIIWNCRGAQSDEFRQNFRSVLDYYKPPLVVLLEMHLQDYA